MESSVLEGIIRFRRNHPFFSIHEKIEKFTIKSKFFLQVKKGTLKVNVAKNTLVVLGPFQQHFSFIMRMGG